MSETVDAGDAEDRRVVGKGDWVYDGWGDEGGMWNGCGCWLDRNCEDEVSGWAKGKTSWDGMYARREVEAGVGQVYEG